MRDLRDRARLALLSVTTAHLRISPGGYEPASAPHGLTLGADPAPLAGPGGLSVSIRHYYQLVRSDVGADWLAETAAYYYSLADRDGREVLAYHWHPMTPAVTSPHLHIELGAVRREVLERAGLTTAHNALRRDLAGAHLPTHQIGLTEFIRMLITQFGIPPRRRDWERLLRA